MSARSIAMWRRAGVVWAVLVACGGEDTRDSGDLSQGVSVGLSAGGTGGDGGGGDDDDDDGGGGDGDGGGDGAVFDLSGGADGEGGANDECDELVVEAELGPRPQDVIFAIDTSGSMFEEAGFVQQYMNSFSIQIEAANVDTHIVLLAEYPFFVAPGVCIDPPLGSGGCPQQDSNPPEFVHVPESEISSTDALMKIIEHYPNYAPFLRPNGVTHVVVVSDDNSALPAQGFIDQFTALSPHLVDFVAHGIIASEDPDAACDAGTACCTLAASQGSVYQELIMTTDGVEGNLCDQEFQPIFQAVAQQVIGGATLACTYEIPPPPQGETFDKDEVNVEFDDGMGGTLEIGRVDAVGDCAGVSDGWYYDDPEDPQLIFVCPQTCEKLQGFESGSVGIKFGCKTIPAG